MKGASANLLPVQTNTLSNIGAVLVAMQVAERIIAGALTLVLPPSQIRTLDDLTRESAANHRATIGALLKKLKQRVDLDEDFEEVLTAFLKDRNDLIHDMDRIPGFDLRSRPGLEVADRFLSNLMENTETVTRAFVSLMVDWCNQVGYEHGKDREILDYLGDFEHIARDVFFLKSPPST